MKVIVKINKFEDIEIINNADGYLISSKHFSYRYEESFCINKTKKAIELARKNNKKVYFNINKIFKDDELEKLTEFIIQLKKIDIDGIFFTDFAVFMIAKDIGFENRCIFAHETFLRNCYDIKTYQELGISKIVCSKDMNLEDISHLPKEHKDVFGILAFGYVPIYESERSTISNYKKQYNIKEKLVDSFDIEIKENTRENYNKIIEQNGITSIFNSEVLCYLDSLPKLEEFIDNFIIDSLFFDAQYIKKVVEAFKKHQTVEYIKTNVEFSDLFLNKRVGLE